jgi:hypothetical protein
MKYTNKAASIIGISTLVCGIGSNAQAQSCANPSQTPVDKPRLEQIANNQGIVNVELSFENFALQTILPGSPITRNPRTFPSPDRDRATNGKYKGVKPGRSTSSYFYDDRKCKNRS